MPFRFRRSFKFLPGWKINLSKSGISNTFGFKGFHVNLGKRGLRQTVGLPGTGISYSQIIPSSNNSEGSITSSPPIEDQKEKQGRHFSIGWLIAASVAAMIWIICVGIPIISSVISAINPTPLPTIDLNAVNTSAVLTAWAPITLTVAAQLTATPTETNVPIPTRTLAPTGTPLPTNTPLPTLTNTAIYVPPSSSHPPGTSGQCVDGSYTYAQHKQGACSHHGGVAVWWGP